MNKAVIFAFALTILNSNFAIGDLLYSTRKISNEDLIKLQTQAEFLNRNCSYCDKEKISKTQRQTQEILRRRHIDTAQQRDIRQQQRNRINDTINIPKTNKNIVNWNRLTAGKGK